MKNQKNIFLIAVLFTLSVTIPCSSLGKNEKSEKKLQQKIKVLPITPSTTEVEKRSEHVPVIHSTALGWVAGEEVTAKFATLVTGDTIKPGGELVLDHRYQIGGTHQLPDDFTLSAVKSGGFDVIDFKTKKENPKGKQNKFLLLGNRTTLRNLTITYVGTPKPGRSAVRPKRDVDFYSGTGIDVQGKDDILIENCKLYGSISHHIKLLDCSRPKVIGCHIVGGFWTIILSEKVSDAVFRECLIEQCQGDAIKTCRRFTEGTVRPLVENCVFQDLGRDAIDTTGGWKDSIVRNCIMRRMFSGMDIKSHYQLPENLISNSSNSNILVENCKFTDMGSCLVFSTLDFAKKKGASKNLLNLENAQKLSPHNIDINNCTFEVTEAHGRGMPMILLKGGHSIRYKNAKFLSNKVCPVRTINVHDVFGASNLSKEVSDALNHSISGTLGPKSAPDAPGENSIPFKYGPR